MNKMEFDADGVKVSVWGEPSGDVHLQIDDNADIVMSPGVATVLGLSISEIASKERPEE